MRKKNNLRKMIMVLSLIACSFGLVACSNDAESKDEQVKNEQSEENSRPLGNIVMKDEDGNILITVEDVLSAETIVNDNNGNKEYCVSLKFTDEGAEKFAEATEQNIGKVISIYVDDIIVSAPMVQAKITGGEAIISGPSQTYEECQELVEKIYGESKSEESEPVESPDLKITENDGTILVTEEEIDTCYCEALDIGKGGSAVDVVIIEFTDEGKEIMAEKTSKLIGEEINLVVKGNLLYDCKLEEAITDGKWVLTGIDDKEDLYKITEELNSVIN